jgi:hypothetical protein
MRPRYLPTACAPALALALAITTPALAAKTCKDTLVSAKSRSSAQVSDAKREARARDKAIANWGKRARESHGYLYSFWSRAEEKNVQCGGGASAKTCMVTAKPCRIY